MNLHIFDRFFFLCIKIYTPKNPLYGDLPVKSAKSVLSLGVTTGRLISTPLTFNNSTNLLWVTDKFWFNNILLMTKWVADSSLLICTIDPDSG